MKTGSKTGNPNIVQNILYLIVICMFEISKSTHGKYKTDKNYANRDLFDATVKNVIY
ncbi:MAG: hypothetical protein LBH30_02870 [Prevotellaceae bacterium]|jgi:hypothetical protein|nr:hypothetical protein [Prevotellaceae bacterium]